MTDQPKGPPKFTPPAGSKPVGWRPTYVPAVTDPATPAAPAAPVSSGQPRFIPPASVATTPAVPPATTETTEKKKVRLEGKAWNQQAGSFHIMPNEIYQDSRLTFSDVKVYAAIAMHYNRKTKQSWPSISTIAEKVGIDERTVRRCIKKLETTKWVEVCGDACKKEKGMKLRTVNFYRLLEPPKL